MAQAGEKWPFWGGQCGLFLTGLLLGEEQTTVFLVSPLVLGLAESWSCGEELPSLALDSQVGLTASVMVLRSVDLEPRFTGSAEPFVPNCPSFLST